MDGSSQALIERAKATMTPNYNPAPFIADRGEGVRLFSKSGQSFLDFSSGIAVTSLGHAHPEVVEAVQEQAGKLFHTSNLFHHEAYVDACTRLSQISCLPRIFLCNSGTEAVEIALKAARRYFADRGEARTKFISFTGGFHGRSYGALSVTFNPKYRHGFEPLLPGCDVTPYDDLAALESALDEHTAAVIVEPIQGNTGVIVPSEGFLAGVRELTAKHGVLLIADEIQTGGGRTGKWMDHQYENVTPDIITMAKAIGGGLPLGAMACNEEISKSLVRGTHGSTYGGNPLACVSGSKTLEIIERDQLMDHAVQLGHSFQTKLKELAHTHSVIVEVRGRGLMLGVELSCEAAPVLLKARELGLLVTLGAPKVLRILPPLIATEDDVAQSIEILEKALKAV